MNKQGKTKIILSIFLTVVLLSSSIYFIFQGDAPFKVDIQNTRTQYYVDDDGSWDLAATEYVYIYDRTTKMRASSRTLDYWNDTEFAYVKRTSTWKDNITTIQTYTFNIYEDKITNVPIKNELECINCEGKFIQYEIRDILYEGETKNIESPFAFGKNMKVEWEENDDFSWAKVYQQAIGEKIIVKFKADEPTETYFVRLFDPPITGNDLTVASGQTVTLGGNNDTYDVVWVQTGGILQVNSTIGYLNLTANNITIDGTVNGNSIITSGTGAGAGGATYESGICTFIGGPGGAGHYAVGGAGGQSSAYGYGGAGGIAYGDNSSIFVLTNGSKGANGGVSRFGTGSGGTGGNGGGAIRMYSQNIDISGTINMYGASGTSGSISNSYSASGGAGGSGGTILLIGNDIDVGGSTLNVYGGSGGGAASGKYGGAGGAGGGSGGFIKIFYSETFSNTSTTVNLNGGSGAASAYQCSSANGGASSSVGSLYIEEIPLSSSSLVSSKNFTTENITGYCNGTVGPGKDMSYYWNLYLEDVLNESNYTGVVTEQTNVVNISSDLLVHNQTWSLECTVSDETYNTTSSYDLKVNQPIWINITSPANASNLVSASVEIAYSFENYTAYDECWYNNGTTNISIDCDGAIGSTLYDDGEHTITIYSNDTTGTYEYSDEVTFNVAAGDPFIGFVSPTPENATWINTDFLYVKTSILPCLTYENTTFTLRSVSLDGY